MRGTKIYGCDICQKSSPFSIRFTEPAREPGYAARGPGERPVGVEDASRETSPGPPGGPLHPGTDAPSLVAPLEMALDPEAWEAFSRGSAAREGLSEAASSEEDAWVSAELEDATSKTG